MSRLIETVFHALHGGGGQRPCDAERDRRRVPLGSLRSGDRLLQRAFRSRREARHHQGVGADQRGEGAEARAPSTPASTPASGGGAPAVLPSPRRVEAPKPEKPEATKGRARAGRPKAKVQQTLDTDSPSLLARLGLSVRPRLPRKGRRRARSRRRARKEGASHDHEP